MPRVPVHREPKPAARRSHENQDYRRSHHSQTDPNYRNSQSYEMADTSHLQNGHGRPRSSGHDHHHHSAAHAKPKRTISTLTAHFVAAVGEFAGTFMFLFFAFAGQMALTSQSEAAQNGLASAQQNIYTALIYGFSLLVNVWAFYRISGGLFNPAVTLGLVLSGGVPPIRGVCLLPAQLLGAIAAAGVVEGLTPGTIAATNTSLSPDTSIAQGVFIEMFMTAELVFIVLMLAVEKSKDTFIAPIGIGLALFVAMMGGVFYTGGSLNPARSFGPAVVAGQFPGYHWIYWIGPCLGALVAAGFYRFVKFFDYEQVNPGQDSAGGDFDEEKGR